ncbi:hypothetical protein [Chitinophaga sp. 212800010-3]|uniref:hypothetical protein n=1 Tax=unclassified Chitinophaga TaxID=2619133 RepID=UPI002DE9C7F4|nr:hypothetical protein [Chitinophaga sp. 212800010-3]
MIEFICDIRRLYWNGYAPGVLFILPFLLFAVSVKAQQSSMPLGIKILNNYHLGDSVSTIRGLTPIDSLKDPFSIEMYFIPFKINYILKTDTSGTIKLIAFSVFEKKIAAVHLLLLDSDSILPALTGQYGAFDLKFTGIGGGYSYHWKKDTSLSYGNVTISPAALQSLGATAITKYERNKMKHIVIKSIVHLIKD